MQSADFLSAVFFYLKVGENLNQNWIVENLNNAFSTWNGKLGELWGLVTTGPQTFKGGAVWSVISLTDRQVFLYERLYHNPVVFLPTPHGLLPMKCTPEQYEQFQRDGNKLKIKPIDHGDR